MFALLPLAVIQQAPVMPPLIERCYTDLRSLDRILPFQYSDARRRKVTVFLEGWQTRLNRLDPGSLGLQDQVDLTLMKNDLNRELFQLDQTAKHWSEIAPVIPFAGQILELETERRRIEEIDPKAAAEKLTALTEAISKAKTTAKEAGLDEAAGTKAAGALRSLQRTLKGWFDHYDSYHPLFSWWCRRPYQDADKALVEYSSWVQKNLAASQDPEAITGDPIGREALLKALEFEMIDESPEELISRAETELEWCLSEMRKASNEMGYGDDWKAALEAVKMLHVEPGEQPILIRDLAQEAVDFLEKHDLVTIEKLCKELWRIEMMSPQRQLITPFFTGGEVISVSYPVEEMTHEQKLMSMRGNNIHFSRATVQHELIPGHHLQGYMTSRYGTHRRPFSTPFWTEGWALYWEFVLYDMGFPMTPEDRIGFLWWRMHRCARVIFSFKFHLNQMSPEKAVKFLVEDIQHEQRTAEGEVRRSFGGMYPPLYQAAYLVGGWQIWDLRKELVDSGKMPEKRFHDTILRNGRIPIRMVGEILRGEM